MLKRFVTLLHRWVGLPLGVLFLVALVSGLIVGGADLWRAVDGKGQTYRETSIAEHARALELMTREMPHMFQALLPTPRPPITRHGRGARQRPTESAISSRSTTGCLPVASTDWRSGCIGRSCSADRAERSESAAPTPSRGSD